MKDLIIHHTYRCPKTNDWIIAYEYKDEWKPKNSTLKDFLKDKTAEGTFATAITILFDNVVKKWKKDFYSEATDAEIINNLDNIDLKNDFINELGFLISCSQFNRKSFKL